MVCTVSAGSSKSLRSVLLLMLIVFLSYWKLVFTRQFTLLAEWEIVNQAYAWYTYAAKSIQSGILPLWDPYRYAGNTFIGEMQTALFYPLNLLLYFSPLDSNGLLSERAFNLFYVFSHWLAALSAFALARYLKLGRFSSLVAATCFALGGYLRVPPWPNILNAMVWLPLVVLFTLRALDGGRRSDRLFYASVAGAALGMTILAGSIHVAIMDAIVAASLAGYVHFSRRKATASSTAMVVATVALVSALTAAIQLLPSIEYAPRAYRWVGGDFPVISSQRIPYVTLAKGTNFSAKSVFAFVLGEVDAGDSDFSTYFGVLPLLLAIIGAWKRWRHPIVRYFTGLAVLAWLYSWGTFSLLHGVLYLVPHLDMARGPDRFIYLTQFSLAILAGFGVQAVFQDPRSGEPLSLAPLLSILKGVVIVFAVILAAASLHLPIAVTDLTYLSFFFIAASYVLLLLAARNEATNFLPVVVVILIVWDLYSFAPLDSKIERQKANQDFLTQITFDRKLADFLASQGKMTRVHFDTPQSPNIGNTYRVPVTWAMSATMLIDYTMYLNHPRRNELFNVGYTVRRKEQAAGGVPVYSDEMWNVYENTDAFPRAWIVHRVEVDRSTTSPLKRLDDPALDLKQLAIVDQPLDRPIGGTGREDTDQTRWLAYEPNRLELETTSNSPGFLVLSEIFYPGWNCEVDGIPARIYRTDGILRGVRIDSGLHRITMRYSPSSVRWGALLSVFTLGGILLCALLRKPLTTENEGSDLV